MEQEEPTLNEIDLRLTLLEAEVRHTDDGRNGFEAVIPAASLKAMLRVISTVDDEANLKITYEGISILLADPANAAMVDIDLMRSAFYEFNVGADLEIGIDVSTFRRILDVADDQAHVSLELSADEETLIIDFGCRFELELLKDVRDRHVLFPKPSLPVSVQIPGCRFAQLVKVAWIVSDHAYIGVNEEGIFFMEAKGDRHSKSVVLRRGNRLLAAEAIAFKEVMSIYSVDYLQGIAEAIPHDCSAVLRIGHDLPLLVEFMCCDGGRVKYIIAPRIENN